MSGETGFLSGAGGCEPMVSVSKFWYVNDTACLVAGDRTVTATCEPTVTTIVYTDALGAVLDPVPPTVTVGYVVAAACGVSTVFTPPVILLPKALTATGTAVITVHDPIVSSITLTRESSGVEFSLDAGVTWNLLNENGSRSWGNSAGARLDVSNMRFRGAASGSKFDIIWEA